MRFQYLSKVEVISTQGERITPDKWIGCAVVPVRPASTRHTYPSLFRAPGLVDAVAPTVSLDMWFMGSTVPIYMKARQHESFFYGVKDFPPEMEWFMRAMNPTPAARRLPDYPSFFYGVKDFIPADWVSYPESPRSVKNVYWLDRNYGFISVVVEEVTLDKWYSESQLLYPVLRVYKNYAYLFAGQVIVIAPLAVGTQVIHYDQAREVLSRMVPPQVIRAGFDINRVHIDFRPDTERSNPASDPTIR